MSSRIGPRLRTRRSRDDLLWMEWLSLPTTRPLEVLPLLHNVQRGITPYRAPAHERYSSVNRVPQHDFQTFIVLHRTKCNVCDKRKCETIYIKCRHNEHKSTIQTLLYSGTVGCRRRRSTKNHPTDSGRGKRRNQGHLGDLAKSLTYFFGWVE